MLFEERLRLEQEDGEPLHTYRLTPEFEAADQCNGAGVLVVAGEHGLTSDDEARFVRPLAELGFFVVGIDLVRERGALDRTLAVNDIASALLYLKELAGGRLGVLGLDVAGAIAMEAATQLPQIDCVVHAGGPGPRKGTKLSRLRGSVQLHRGTRDALITEAECAEMLERIRPSRQMLLTCTYDALPSFFVRPTVGEQDLAVEAWDRTTSFLAQQLI